MKKDIEVEVNSLEAMIRILTIPNDNMKTILKQISIVKKAIVPKKSNRNHNYNSGLLKPLRISASFADFAGWKHDELHSRVEVTKVLCEYITKNKIQKESDRRIILLDSKLKEILNYQDDEITYPYMQKCLGIHFIKDEPVEHVGEILETKEPFKDVKKVEGTKDVKKKKTKHVVL